MIIMSETALGCGTLYMEFCTVYKQYNTSQKLWYSQSTTVLFRSLRLHQALDIFFRIVASTACAERTYSGLWVPNRSNRPETVLSCSMNIRLYDHNRPLILQSGGVGGSATFYQSRDGGVEELHGDPTAGHAPRSGPEVKNGSRDKDGAPETLRCGTIQEEMS